MLRRPRNARTDRLTDWKLFFQVYFITGLQAWIAAMGMWFFYWSQYAGFGFFDLMLVFDQWEDTYKGRSIDFLNNGMLRERPLLGGPPPNPRARPTQNTDQASTENAPIPARPPERIALEDAHLAVTGDHNASELHDHLRDRRERGGSVGRADRPAEEKAADIFTIDTDALRGTRLVSAADLLTRPPTPATDQLPVHKQLDLSEYLCGSYRKLGWPFLFLSIALGNATLAEAPSMAMARCGADTRGVDGVRAFLGTVHYFLHAWDLGEVVKARGEGFGEGRSCTKAPAKRLFTFTRYQCVSITTTATSTTPVTSSAAASAAASSPATTTTTLAATTTTEAPTTTTSPPAAPAATTTTTTAAAVTSASVASSNTTVAIAASSTVATVMVVSTNTASSNVSAIASTVSCNAPVYSPVPLIPVNVACGQPTCTVTINYNLIPASGCALTCTMTLNAGSAVSAGNKLLTISSSIATGPYTISLSCTDPSGASYPFSIPIWITKTTVQPIINVNRPVSLPDITKYILPPTVLSSSGSGGEPASFIGYLVVSMVMAKVLVYSTSSLLWVASETFTQDDINNGRVAIETYPLTTFGQSAAGSIGFTVSVTWPGTFATESSIQFGTVTTGSVALSINYMFAPTVDPLASLTITVGSNQQELVTIGELNMVEAHSLGLADMGWTISPQSPGVYDGSKFVFSWACPDVACALKTPPVWSPVYTGTSMYIEQNWIANGLVSITGLNPSTTTLLLMSTHSTAPNLTLAVDPIYANLTIIVSSNATTAATPAAPSIEGTCLGLSVNTGGVSTGLALPLNSASAVVPYVSPVNSPMRPLCLMVQSSTSGTAANLVPTSDNANLASIPLTITAGLTATSTTLQNIYVSFYVNVGTGVLPSGFNLLVMTFPSSSSSSALSITAPSGASFTNFYLTTPEIRYDLATNITSVSQLSVLSYENTTGTVTHVSPDTWYAQSPARLGVSLPGPGVYILCTMSSAVTVLPVAAATKVTYQGGWGSKTLRFLQMNSIITGFTQELLRIHIVSSENRVLTVSWSPTTTLWSPAGYTNVEFFTASCSPEDASYKATLTYYYSASTLKTEGIDPTTLVWGLFIADTSNPEGGAWSFTDVNSTVDTTAGAVNGVTNLLTGQWGVFAAQGVVSAAAGLRTNSLGAVLTLMALAILTLW
ncbi:hypothetical protein BDK51DRAFT_51656 [Blyttiomyces helicus]|uniref:Uncharacterized protein n=1 Tax=Blyttiomyces helicus TaxID=388810 RepID=A0A4P9WCC6_9FUNG|nr:hypothetical protein BDK51DRAFT_51656 [Blyttiomyces helicus]|eukprot:RKO89295.1 hypothetical protein BDK51DRAFT_51656 [Blyttiomyces helicus]